MREPNSSRISASLSEADLEEIEKRAAAATPGPWRASDSHGLCVSAPEVMVADMYQPDWYGSRDDATFIAAARADVPALVADLREARDAAYQAVAARAVQLGARNVIIVYAGAEGPCSVADQLAKLVGERDRLARAVYAAMACTCGRPECVAVEAVRDVLAAIGGGP